MTTVSDLRFFLKRYRDLFQPFSCNRFSKILRIFYASKKIMNNQIIPSMHAVRKIATLFDQHSFTLHSSLSPYSQTESQRNKYTCFAWAGGTFFPVVLLCKFLVLAGNRFWFYILLYLEYNTVVVLC